MKIISRKEAKELGLSRFFTGKPCKNGHISERAVHNLVCIGCKKLDYQKRKDAIIAKEKQKYQDNRAEKIASSRRYYKLNRDKILKQKSEYHANNPIPQFARDCLKRIQNNWKGGRGKTEDILGYTFEELRRHIESQFKDGMSWDNRSEWHIDHIKPISVLVNEGVTDPRVINALSNLQPLWASENFSKNNKWDGSKNES